MDDEFRDIDEFTSEDIAGHEIDKILSKKEVPRKSVQTKEAKEMPKENLSNNEPEPAQKKQEIKQEVPKQKKVTKPMVKKKVVKQKVQTKTVASEEKTGDKWITIIVTAIAIIAVVLAAYFIFTSVTNKEANTVAAVVNGVAIYNSDVDTRMQIIKNTENPFITKEETLEETINQELLVQEAKKLGIQVTDKELEDTLKTSLALNGLTMDDFKANLVENNLDYDSVMKFYKENMISFMLINQTVIEKSKANDLEIKLYYEENMESFLIPEMAQARHILVAFKDESENETLALAEEIFDEIENDKSNYCDLVKKYSNDTASIPYCGEYNFTKEDFLVPEFLDAGFAMKPGEIKIVKTQFGYHIMYKIADLPERTLNLSEVEDSVKVIVERQKASELYNELLEKLRAKAVIEIYTAEGEEVPTTVLEDEEEVKVATEETDEVIKEEDESKTPVVAEEPRKDFVQTEITKQKTFSECVAEKAVMYTVYWAPDNKEQLSIFGSDKDKIVVVECDASAENNKASECNKFGFTTYPNWVIDGKVWKGVQSQLRLSEATGCPY